MKKLLLAVVFVAGLAAAPSTALATDANGNHDTYIWIVATDTAMAPDGTTITIRGQGVLSAGPDHMAIGAGTFTTSGGGSGSWAATAVQGFVSYGPAGPQPFPLPPGSTGGEAKLKVSLSNGMTGVLTITCVLGSPPPSAMEGITLVLGAGVSAEYTMPAGGNTLFIAA